jgi:SsrA-binding protein
MEIINRKASFDYDILETFEVGIVLKGTEIKSIREGRTNLKDSYAIIRNNELFLLNMHISHYEKGNIFNHDETRTRKLLMHKKEINKLSGKLEQGGLTLIPLKLYFKKNKAKILLGLAKGKKSYDKREAIKKKDMEREIRKEMKQYMK